MDFLKNKLAPHFVSFLTGVVLSGIAGHFGGVSAIAITAYLVGAYGSQHVVKFISSRLN